MVPSDVCEPYAGDQLHAVSEQEVGGRDGWVSAEAEGSQWGTVVK
jgi:hypothetical protein